MIVVGDEGRRARLAQSLADRGLHAVVATEESVSDTMAANGLVDVIVAHRTTPFGDGLGLCLRLSLLRSPPVILLLPEPDEADRIVALEVGADDCLADSVSPRELLSRIQALARRAAMQREAQSRGQSTRFVFAGWRLCLTTRELRAPGGQTLFLAHAESSLLRAFVEHPLEVLTRERLRSLIGDAQDGDGKRVVDWRVSRLRSRLEKAGAGASLIRTVNGRGYLFDADVRLI